MKQNIFRKIKLILLIISFIIIFSFLNLNYVFANETYEENLIEAEENRYSDAYKEYLKLSDEEKAKLNVIPEKYKYTVEEYLKDKENEISFFNNVEIPSYFNLRDEINIKVENQGSYGLCWAFASNNAVETYIALNENKIYDLSEMHPNYLTSFELYNSIGKGSPVRALNSGGNFHIYYEEYALKEAGPVLESDVPYILQNNYNQLASYSPVQYVYDVKRFPDITWEKNSEVKNEIKNDIKKHIMTNGSLYASICSYNMVKLDDGNVVLNEKNLANQYERDHAISIIGWDDNFPKEKFPFYCRPVNDGAYIALNSWGNSFGDNGVFYISYEDILVQGELSGVTYVSDEPYSTVTLELKDRNFYNALINNTYNNLIVARDDQNLKLVVKEQFLKLVSVLDLTNVTDLTGIENFTNLEVLYLFADRVIYSNLDDIKYLQNLSVLGLFNIYSNNWDFLKNLTNIDSIYIDNINAEDISFINNYKLLRYLYIKEGYTEHTGELSLYELSNLIDITITTRKSNIKDISIKSLPIQVQRITIDGVMFDTSILEGRFELESLEIRNKELTDLNFLSRYMNRLHSIFIDGTGKTDISNLETFSFAQNISVYISNNEITNFMDLIDNNNLKLYFDKCYKAIRIEEPIITNMIKYIKLPEEISFFENDYYKYLGWDEFYKVKVGTIGTKRDSSNLNIIIKKEEERINDSCVVYVYNENAELPDEDFIVSYTFYYDTVDINNIEEPIAFVNYKTHVQNIGWQNYVSEGNISGTSGKGYRLEGINIDLVSNVEGNIEYTTHVQNIGWQDYVLDDEMSGTSGMGLRLEGIKIRLTGKLAEMYDIYYRVHIQNTGWLSWAKNDEVAGSSGYGFRLEGIQIVIVKKGEEPPEMNPKAASLEYFQEKVNVIYSTHIENIGWPKAVRNGVTSGAIGQGLRIEGLKVKLEATTKGDVQYSVHVQNKGWLDFVGNNEYAGTTGQGLRVEGIRIELTDDLAEKYSIYYRIYVEGESDWQGWAKDGEDAGSVGLGKKLEGIQVVIKRKSESAPAGTDRPACLTKDN